MKKELRFTEITALVVRKVFNTKTDRHDSLLEEIGYEVVEARSSSQDIELTEIAVEKIIRSEIEGLTSEQINRFAENEVFQYSFQVDDEDEPLDLLIKSLKSFCYREGEKLVISMQE